MMFAKSSGSSGRGVIIRTVINNFTFDGATTDPIRKAVRDALIAFKAATARGHRRRPRKPLSGAGIEHAKGKDDAKYLGRKPSYTRRQFTMVRHVLGQDAVGVARIAKETGLTRQTVYRIKDDPAGAEAALAAWGMRGECARRRSRVARAHSTGERRRNSLDRQVRSVNETVEVDGSRVGGLLLVLWDAVVGVLGYKCIHLFRREYGAVS
jgi:Helix-turn-helix domain of resolvase